MTHRPRPFQARWIPAILMIACLAPAAPAQNSSNPVTPFELRDQDRVILLGNTFIEREQQHAYIETALTRRFPDRDVVFRNLGWSGDVVTGHSRGRFGGAPEGWKHLVQHVTNERPTVILVSYGHNAAHEGPEGLSSFQSQLARLCDFLDSTKARIVFISPFRYEKLAPPLPDPTPYNRNLKAYVDALQSTANQRGYRFVNLYELLPTRNENHPDRPALTYNSIHLSADGYKAAAAAVLKGLALDRSPLPEMEASQVEKLRQTILKKNELYFHRYRPQNETYLYLFRKHEQGNNAVEVPRFDPLIAEQEQLITTLRKP